MKILLTFLTFLALSSSANAKDCDIIIKNHQFQSGNLVKTDNKNCEFALRSGKKHRLKICNQDNKVAEFESFELLSEKIIAANKSAIIKIKKLKKGKIYHFFEEFHGAKCQFKAI